MLEHIYTHQELWIITSDKERGSGRAGLLLAKEPKGSLEWGTDAEAPIAVPEMSYNHIREGVDYSSDL